MTSLAYDDLRVEALAERLTEHKPDAAILALADAGVSMSTTPPACERRGIPTVILANPAERASSAKYSTREHRA